MGITYNNAPDAVVATQNKLIQRGAFVNMQTDFSDFVGVNELWKNKREGFEGGINVEIEYQMSHNNSAKAVGLYQTDSSSVTPTLKKGEVPQRHVNAHYIFDVREPAFQRGGIHVVKLVKSKYVAMMLSFYETMEDFIWGKPDDSSDDETPWGVAYWVVKNASTGFYGGNPAGFSSGRGGIDSSTWTRYKNYTGTYASIIKTDLFRSMRKFATVSKFKSPVNHATPERPGMGNGIYTNYAVVAEMEERLEENNTNLGNDVAPKDGRTTFKSTPITYVPFLDADTTNPVYMLDWRWLYIAVLNGWENALTKPYRVAGKHNVRRVDLDVTANMVGIEPRKQAVFYAA